MTGPTPTEFVPADPVGQWMARLAAAQPAAVLDRLASLEAQMTTSTVTAAVLAQQIYNLEGRMSATDDKIAAISAQLDTVSGNVGNVANDVQGLQTEVQSLKDQLAAVDPALAEKLGPLEAKVQSLADSTQALADSVPDAPAPPAP